jgi:hypothetical protein
MIKFYEWFTNNRQTIGIVIGILNLLAGLGNLLIGGLLTAVLQLAAGALILQDAWMLGHTNEKD